MPLIRYRIGDLVEKRELPFGTRYVLHGRAADAFRTPQGQRVTTRQVDQCFVGISGIAHYQLHARRAGAWLMRYVPDAIPPTPESLSRLQTNLSQVLELKDGLELEATDLLLAESSGKFRLCYPAGSTS
jgi:phenylacetate-coenzyme A ligase PaaK-like adenylate-forming protein